MEELYKEKRVVIYARVSTEHEAQVYALENQLDWYRQILAAKPEWDLVGTYIDEGITGTSAEKRPTKLIARMPDDNSQVIKEKEAETERYSEREKDLEEMLAKGMISPGVYEIQHLEDRKRLLLLESELELLRKEADLPDPEITGEERQRCRSRLEAAAEAALRYNISADVMREFVERIAIGNTGISVYLCFNTNPYIFFREYYPEHQFARLERTLIGTGHLTRENTAKIFHPGPDDPYYRLKGIDVKIYV